ncbi:MAG: choice-of-anchor tandem repeat GloVer-containing protein [Candidatus Sulfotelmatobacter sp.]
MTSQKRLFAKSRMAAVVLELLTFASGALLHAQTERSLYHWSYPQIEDVRGGLVADSSGNLYGTSVFGGTENAGTVFELSPPAAPGGAWTESVLYNFPGDNSAGPGGTLVFDSNGNLYGTAVTGGEYGGGAVFQLAPPAAPGGAWTEKTIASLDQGYPYAGLAIAANNVLYGATGYGGVFQVTPDGDSWTFATIYLLQSNSTVVRNLILDAKGNLYGTSQTAGEYDSGYVFGLRPPTKSGGKWSEVDIYDFRGGADGGAPITSLTLKAGVLYGTTSAGGATSNGTVFSLTPPTAPNGPWTEAVLYSFAGGSEGASPEAGVVFGSGGALYGTTWGNTVSAGTSYKLTPPSEPGGEWTQKVIHNFDGLEEDGGQPVDSLLLFHGAFFGTTSSPSAVFEISQ